ncbi:MAG: cysteine peptidase family C39 domain-containing protein, partial [Prevotella sp.]|nr:cysteine peptidase family C39 domain-containing protein [Prevotella sp.]
MKFPIIYQNDSMQCGIACLQMVSKYFGREYSLHFLSDICFATSEGVSMLGISEAANEIGLHSVCAKATAEELSEVSLPCILHWNQNHFVVLYKVKRGKKFYIADPGKGLITYNIDEFKSHWISTRSNGEEKGVAMFLQTTPLFYTCNKDVSENKQKRSFKFLFGYVKQYRRYFGQIVLGLIVGSLLQLVLPFLTQSIVDVGIKNQDIGFIWLVLLGQLMLTVSRTVIDFIRRWLLLHISMRIK